MGPIAIFLRGINVGGIQIRMTDLKAMFEAKGWTDVSTLLASGNVVATPPDEPTGAAVKRALEDALGDRFHYDAHVILRDQSQIAALLEAARAIKAPEGFQFYVLLCEDTKLGGELQTEFDGLSSLPGEQYLPAGQDAFWLVPKGSTLESPFGKRVLGAKAFKARLTSRNVQTIEKVHAMLSSSRN